MAKGLGRPDSIRNVLILGAAVPLVGACADAAQTRAAPALTSRQLAGQRAICFSGAVGEVDRAVREPGRRDQLGGHRSRAEPAATAKHFPGLGSATTSQNTDLRPVTLNVPLSGLRARDEVPYAAAIAAGVKLIMASWAVYPALAARAGMDLRLRSAQNPAQGQAVVTALASALDRGQLGRTAFNAAVGRVSALRQGLQ